MKCVKCGATLEKDAKFCSNCGVDAKSVSDEVASIEMTQSSVKSEAVIEKIKKKICDYLVEMDWFCRISVALFAVIVILALVAFWLHNVLAIFLSIIQLVGVILAVLIHKSLTRCSKIGIKYIVLSLVAVLIIFNIMSYSAGKKSVDLEAVKETVTSLELPFNSSDCIGKDYLSIGEALGECGFLNISYKEIEDLTASEGEKLGQIESISIDGKTEFRKSDVYDSNKKIIISYHTYMKCTVKVHVNFISNLFFSKYDVEFYFDGVNEGKLNHGEDGDFELSVIPGEYPIEFVSVDSMTVKGESTLEVTGDVNISYKISCFNDEISVAVEYVENLGEVGANEIMMPQAASDYKYKNYKDIEPALEDLGFTNISTEILYDIVWGWTDEGEIESVSIAGTTDFKRGDIFSKNAAVVITYHMKEEAKEQEELIEKETVEQEEVLEQESEDVAEKSDIPVMEKSSLDRVVATAADYGLSEVDDEDFGHGTRMKSMSDSAGGLLIDVIYSSGTKELLCASIITNKIASLSEQKNFVKGMAGVLCPNSDASEISSWVSSNVGTSESKEIGGFTYELSLGTVDNVLYFAGEREWETWELSQE